jgi:hypothetical protein
MWSGGVIDTCDGHDLVNVVFQSRHLNRIMARLKMSRPFRDLHREDREDFVVSAIRAISDALPSPGVNPLEGSPKYSCEKLGLGRHSRLPTLERGRGSSWEPRDYTRKKI